MDPRKSMSPPLTKKATPLSFTFTSGSSTLWHSTKVLTNIIPRIVWFKNTLRIHVPSMAHVSPEATPVCGVR